MPSQWASPLADRDVLVTKWRQHPLVLALSATPAVITAVLAMLSRSGRLTGVTALLWGLTLLLTLRFAWRAAQWSVDWTIVTDRQIRRLSGLLAQTSRVMPLAHVTDLTCHRSILGRVCGYGECMLQAAGQVEPLRLSLVPNPDKHHRILTQLVATEHDGQTAHVQASISSTGLRG